MPLHGMNDIARAKICWSPRRPARSPGCRDRQVAGSSPAGPTIFPWSELERAFRDMYTGTQRTFIGEKTYTDAAQIMLGLIPDSPGL